MVTCVQTKFPPCRQDNHHTQGFINHGIDLSHVAVRVAQWLAVSVMFLVRSQAWPLCLNISPYQLTRALLRSGIKAVGKTVWEVLFFSISLLYLMSIGQYAIASASSGGLSTLSGLSKYSLGATDLRSLNFTAAEQQLSLVHHKHNHFVIFFDFCTTPSAYINSICTLCLLTTSSFCAPLQPAHYHVKQSTTYLLPSWRRTWLSRKHTSSRRT